MLSTIRLYSLRHALQIHQAASAMSVKKKALALAIAVAGLTITLWLCGVWTSSSPRYWRAMAQSAMLALAEHSSAGVAVPLVHWSMGVHAGGVTLEEQARAAEVLDGSGRGSQAAVLWLGLANGHTAGGHRKEAIEAATRASRSSPSSGPAVALVMLHWDSGQRGLALAHLVQNWPDHEIVRALLCLGDLRSLQDEVPESCGAVDWVDQRVRHARSEYARRVAELESLPETAAIEAVNAEYKLAEAERDVQAYAAEVDVLRRERNSMGINSALTVGLKVVLPELPERGDTLESYGVRFALCLFPVVKYFCAAKDISEERDAYSQSDARLQERIDSTVRLGQLTITLVDSYRDTWRDRTSAKPFEQLVATRNAILPDLRAAIESQLVTRHTPVGLSPSQAIASVVDAGTDGFVFAVLGHFHRPLEGPRNTQDLMARIALRPNQPPLSASVGGRRVDARKYVSLLDAALADERAAVYRVGITVRSGRYGGAWIDAVLPESPAHRSGIAVGDVVHAIDGTDTPSYEALRNEIAKRCGGVMSIRLYRPSLDAQLTMSVPTSQPFPCLGVAGSDYVIDRRHPEIVSVTKPSGRRAGMASGDLIVTADGTWIESSEEFVDALQKFARTHPAAPIRLVLQRRGQEVAVSVPIVRERQ